MVNDSAREELLQLNISGPLGTARRIPPSSGTLEVPGVTVKAPVVPAAIAPAAPEMKVKTSDLPAKNTNPTLVGFQNDNASLPDWRLKLQNAVRQRSSGGISSADAVGSADRSQPAVYQKHLVTSGANALKAEYVAEAAPVAKVGSNDKLAAALKRIEQSRQLYTEPAVPQKPVQAAPATKNYPFNVVAPSVNAPASPAAGNKATVNVLPRPRLISSLRLGKEVLDTNKLPPIPESIKISSSFDKPFSSHLRDSGPLSDEVIHIPKVEEEEFIDETPLDMIESEAEIESHAEVEVEAEKNEIEDL